MTKLVSFSVFGTSSKYHSGALANLELVRTILPDWKCAFFCGASVPSEMTDQLEALGGIVVRLALEQDQSATLWRYRAFSEFTGVERFLARDADSLITAREVAMIRDWERSDKDLFVIRDHPNHIWDVPGGLVGFKRSSENIVTKLRMVWSSPNRNYYGCDADLLYWYLWRDRSNSRFVVDTCGVWPRDRKRYGSSSDYCGRVAFSESGEMDIFEFNLPQASTAAKFSTKDFAMKDIRRILERFRIIVRKS